MAEKINSPDDLCRARDRARAEVDLRSGEKDYRITVHMGTCGIAAGAPDVLAGLADALEDAHVGNVTLSRSGCLGLCDQEPMLTISDKAGNEFRYGRVDRDRVRRIVNEHVVKGNPVIDWLIGE